MTCAKDFDPGRRRRPLELTTGRGAPVLSARVEYRVRASPENSTHRVRRCKQTKEQFSSRALLYQVLFWDTQDLHDARQLLLLILAWEERHTRVHLGEDASQRPHVNGHVIVGP